MTSPNLVIAGDTDTSDSTSVDEDEDWKPEESEPEEDKGDHDEEYILCEACKKKAEEVGISFWSCPRSHKEVGVVPAAGKKTQNVLKFVFERQISPSIPKMKPAFRIPDQLSCGVIRYHSRSITCLEFHPTKHSILLSGDMKGHLGVWDFDKVEEKTVYDVHSSLLHNMKINPMNDGTLYSSSSDGTVAYTDIETGIAQFLVDLNPNHVPGTYRRSLYGLDIQRERKAVLVADGDGYLYMLDLRSNNAGGPVLIHKNGSKVLGLQCNPVQPDLLLSCGSDRSARIWDIRRLETGSSIYDLAHNHVVNSAYFSPVSGTKIVTTSENNHIRVWDSIFGSLDSPSRVILHSHDTYRAEWDMKDPSESLVVIGTYISGTYDGNDLHPIDFIDVSTGQVVAKVMDTKIKSICPVNKLHPRDDILATGSGRSLFIWRPKENKSEIETPKDERKNVLCGTSSEKKTKEF